METAPTLLSHPILHKQAEIEYVQTLILTIQIAKIEKLTTWLIDWYF